MGCIPKTQSEGALYTLRSNIVKLSGTTTYLGALMLVTLVSMVMVTAWALVITLIWAMVRKFHRSKPPGRQTVRVGDWCTVH